MRLIIEGNPIPLQRARSSKGRFYDSQFEAKKNFAFEVKDQFSKDKVNRHIINKLPFKQPVELNVQFYFQMPKSWSEKKKVRLNGTPHTARKDLDNLIKWVGDVLNEIVWEDDAQIWSITSCKTWSYEGLTIIDFTE